MIAYYYFYYWLMMTALKTEIINFAGIMQVYVYSLFNFVWHLKFNPSIADKSRVTYPAILAHPVSGCVYPFHTRCPDHRKPEHLL